MSQSSAKLKERRKYMLKFYTSQLRKCQSMCTICSRVASTFGTFIQCSEVLPSIAKTVHLYGMTTTKRALCSVLSSSISYSFFISSWDSCAWYLLWKHYHFNLSTYQESLAPRGQLQKPICKEKDEQCKSLIGQIYALLKASVFILTKASNHISVFFLFSPVYIYWFFFFENCYQKPLFSSVFSVALVDESAKFKCENIKKCAFSYENTLLWSGP